MTNIASVLKAEIARVARKEIRAEIESLKKASLQHRHAVAQMRREVAELERALKQARKSVASASSDTSKSDEKAAVPDAVDDGTPRRFSASRLAAHRAKLGLSAADYGKLVGMSGATIYNWEHGKGRPKPEQVQALGMLKLLSPTVARARLVSST